LSYFRQVQTFASIAPTNGGSGMFDSDVVDDQGPGLFEREVMSAVEDPHGSTAQGHAVQSSTIMADAVRAAASFSASAHLQGETQFAEGLGFTKLSYQFEVDTSTPYVIDGTLIADGNGRASILLLGQGSGALVDVTAVGSVTPVHHEGVLQPGRYQYDVWTSGYGQAIAPDQNHPASGSFDVAFDLTSEPSAAPTPGIGAAGTGAAAARIYPNPVRLGSSIALSNLSESARGVRIFDSTGRAVRTLRFPGAQKLVWDLRDQRGEPVSPGLYFVRVDGQGAAKAIVLR